MNITNHLIVKPERLVYVCFVVNLVSGEPCDAERRHLCDVSPCQQCSQSVESEAEGAGREHQVTWGGITGAGSLGAGSQG